MVLPVLGSSAKSLTKDNQRIFQGLRVLYTKGRYGVSLHLPLTVFMSLHPLERDQRQPTAATGAPNAGTVSTRLGLAYAGGALDVGSVTASLSDIVGG